MKTIQETTIAIRVGVAKAEASRIKAEPTAIKQILLVDVFKNYLLL